MTISRLLLAEEKFLLNLSLGRQKTLAAFAKGKQKKKTSDCWVGRTYPRVALNLRLLRMNNLLLKVGTPLR